jgi:uncharacterized protein YecE (DUF72 family)
MATKIGISGWRYDGWRGIFYPKGLQQARELEFASRVVDTIEINGSHYSLQKATSYESWYAATPERFVFSVKGPRYLTHMLRFRDDSARPAIANFFSHRACLPFAKNWARFFGNFHRIIHSILSVSTDF